MCSYIIWQEKLFWEENVLQVNHTPTKGWSVGESHMSHCRLQSAYSWQVQLNKERIIKYNLKPSCFNGWHEDMPAVWSYELNCFVVNGCIQRNHHIIVHVVIVTAASPVEDRECMTNCVNFFTSRWNWQRFIMFQRPYISNVTTAWVQVTISFIDKLTLCKIQQNICESAVNVWIVTMMSVDRTVCSQ